MQRLHSVTADDVVVASFSRFVALVALLPSSQEAECEPGNGP
jgi:hypothetical protein